MSEYVYATDEHKGHWLTGEEIVRCRDCKESYLFDMSWKTPKENDKRYCKYGTYLQYEVPDDGFCSWGERKERIES